MGMKKLLLVMITAALIMAPATWGQLKFFQRAEKTVITYPESPVWLDGMTLHVVYTEVSNDEFPFQLERLIVENDVRVLDLHLNNGGGSGLLMFDIIDTVERLKRDRGLVVITHARGCIASAAIPLFLMGDTRIAYENTLFMIHPAGGWNHPYLEACQRILMAELTIRYCAYVEAKTNMSYMWCWDIIAPEDLEDNAQTHQYWFNSKEALMMGFATEIR